MTRINSNQTTFILKFILLICIQQVSQICYAQSVSIKQLKIGKSSENVFASDYFNGSIYYCSDRKNKSHKTVENEYNQNFLDLYSIKFALESKRLGDEVLLDTSINSALNEGPIDIRDDGGVGYFSSNRVDSATTELFLALFQTTLNDNDNFQKREEVFGEVYNHNVAHPTISEDGKVLVFSSDNIDSKGQTDLYMSVLVNSEWSKPEVIEGLNTVAIETFPHFYGNTLYFSSDRIGSLGGLDIFKSSFNNGKFSEPEHLENPVNSEFDDFLYIPITETQGLLSSNRNGTKDKIYEYQIDLPQPSDFIEVNDNFCYYLSDDGNIDTTRFKHTWVTGDGEEIMGKSVSHCYKDTGMFSVSCNLLDTKTGKSEKSFISTEISIDISTPIIQAEVSGGSILLSFDNKYSQINYTENYWIVNDDIYTTKDLEVPFEASDIEVKLVVWERKKSDNAIGVVKKIKTNP